MREVEHFGKRVSVIVTCCCDRDCLGLFGLYDLDCLLVFGGDRDCPLVENDRDWDCDDYHRPKQSGAVGPLLLHRVALLFSS
jgi:hypothetical protein